MLRFLILARCYFALRTTKFRLCCFIVAMILDAGAVRHGGEGFQPYIDGDAVAAVAAAGLVHTGPRNMRTSTPASRRMGKKPR